jgi:hypothetical protein|tara:strand:+ start:739 stop:933 length:195 start_codon:yes stop_codon:yes gene_type:complete
MLELIMIFGLFTNDNAEFFAAGEVNKAAGLKWEYVGSQPVPEGHVAIPSVNPDTGKETVIFVRK